MITSFFTKFFNSKFNSLFLVIPAGVVLFTLPFQMFPFAGVKTYFFLGVLSLVCGIFAIRKWINKKSLVFSFDRVDIVFGIFVAGMMITSLLGIDPLLSFFSTLDRGVSVMLWIGVYSYFLLLKRVLVSDPQKIKVIDMSLVVASVICSLLIWGAHFGIFSRGYLNGLQGNSSLAGAVFLLCLPSFLVLFRNAYVKKNFKIFLGISILLCAVFLSPLFFTNMGLGESRGVVIALCGTIAPLLGFYFVSRAKKSFNIIGISILALCIGALLFIGTTIFVGNSKTQDFFKDHSGSNRLLFWDTALQAIHEKPWSGYGNETFEYSFFTHFDPQVYRGQEGWADKPHNAYIEILHDNGIVVFAVYLLMIGYLYLLLYRMAKNKDTQIEACIYFFVLTAYLLQNSLVFDSPTSVVLLGVLFARISYRENKEYSFSLSFKYAPLVLIGAVASLYFFALLPFSEGNKMYWLMSMSIERVGEYTHPVFSTSYVGGVTTSAYVANQLMNSIENDTGKGMHDYSSSVLGLIDAVKSESRSENSFPAYLFEARGYTYVFEKTHDKKYLESAEESAKQSVIHSPLNPEGYWVFAYVYYLDGNSKESLLAARTVIELDPELEEGYKKLIFLAQKFGNVNVEKGTREDALKHFPLFDK